LLVTLQEQLLDTATVPVLPVEPKAVRVGEALKRGELVGEMLQAHVVGPEPFCVTVKVSPPIATVPVLGPPVLADTE
jgi:hypothetical protein